MSVSSSTDLLKVKDVIKQLESSGSTFTIEFIGTVSVTKSLNSFLPEEKKEIGEACIKCIAKAANRKECVRVESMVLKECLKDPEVINTDIDINITSKAFLVIQETDDRPKMLYKFAMQDISLLVPGTGDMINYFCFFAKTKNAKTQTSSRKCLVFYAGDEKTYICATLFLAFKQAEKKLKAIPSPSENCRSASKSPVSSASSSATSTLSYRAPPRPPARYQDHEIPPPLTLKSYLKFTGVTERLNYEPWYHGLISRTTTENMITRNNQFLVRESERSPNQVVLSGMQNNQQSHILLLDKEGRIRTPDKEFRTISELINYYQATQQPLSSGDSILILGEPVNRRHS